MPGLLCMLFKSWLSLLYIYQPVGGHLSFQFFAVSRMLCAENIIIPISLCMRTGKSSSKQGHTPRSGIVGL